MELTPLSSGANNNGSVVWLRPKYFFISLGDGSGNVKQKSSKAETGDVIDGDLSSAVAYAAQLCTL